MPMRRSRVSPRFGLLGGVVVTVGLACSGESGLVVVQSGSGEPSPSTSAPPDPLSPSVLVSPSSNSPAATPIGSGDLLPAMGPGNVATSAPMPTVVMPVSVEKGVNLIKNGDFISGDMFWRVDDGVGNTVIHSTGTGALCFTLSATQPYVSVAWPLDAAMSIPLESAGVYQLTYEAWSSQPDDVVFEAKVRTTQPVTERLGVEVPLTPTSKSHSHAFNSPSPGASGVLFEVIQAREGAEVCIDNVSLKSF
jgi:hypothetical protein